MGFVTHLKNMKVIACLSACVAAAMADDYSKANFNAEESSDGAGSAQGSYSVALPDGRIQHVTYTANGYDGYVADVTYEGTAQYPEYVAPAYKAAPAYPVPAYSG